jgi:hypothetical protein
LNLPLRAAFEPRNSFRVIVEAEFDGIHPLISPIRAIGEVLHILLNAAKEKGSYE